VTVGLPVLGCLLLALVGPTAGRWLVDVSSGVTPKSFIKGEWFIGTALRDGAVWILVYWAGAGTWWRRAASCAASRTGVRDLGLLVEEDPVDHEAGVTSVNHRSTSNVRVR